MIAYVFDFICLFLSLEDQKNNMSSRKEEILNIIEREFDLELLLKYREMRILEHEIERGKELKGLLEKLILNGKLCLCF